MPEPQRETEHTPGPWEVGKFEDYHHHINAKTKDGVPWLSMALVACIDLDDCDSQDDYAQELETSLANARLIAAAPELLAACKAITQGYECAFAEAEDVGTMYCNCRRCIDYRAGLRVITKAEQQPSDLFEKMVSITKAQAKGDSNE